MNMEEDLKTELNSISQNNAEYFSRLSSKLEKIETSSSDINNSTKDEIIKMQSSIVQQNIDLKKDISDSLNKVDSAIVQRLGIIEGLINNQYSQLKGENSSLQTEKVHLIQKNGKLEAEIESLKRELSTEKQNNTDKQYQITQLNKDISNEKANSSKLSSDIGMFKAQIESLKRELSTEKQNNTDKQYQITQLNKDISNEKANSSKLSSDIGMFKAQIENLNSQLSTEKETCHNKNEEINKLSSVINEKNKEIESTNSKRTELQQELEKLQNNYNSLNNYYKSLNIDDTLLVAFNEFSSLKEKTKASLAALFPQTSFLGFISAGLRLSNITSLWEMAKRNIFNNNLDDIDKINTIFNLLMSIYNDGSKEVQFQIISPEIGSKYDSSNSAIKEMKSSGTVKEVLLVGYKNVKDGNIHKAVISVNE